MVQTVLIFIYHKERKTDLKLGPKVVRESWVNFGFFGLFLGYIWAYLLTHECSRALKREEKSNFAQTFSVLLTLKQKFD